MIRIICSSETNKNEPLPGGYAYLKSVNPYIFEGVWWKK
jgi:hypothetical protein